MHIHGFIIIIQQRERTNVGWLRCVYFRGDAQLPRGDLGHAPAESFGILERF